MELKASLLFPAGMSTAERQEIRAFAAMLMHDVASGQPFVCCLTSDARLRELNRDFLGHDEPTDVLSFPEGDSGEFGGGPSGLGEIAISVDRARAQAAEQGHTWIEEVKILLLHGLLHLMGLDHETDRGQMRRVESKLRRQYELPSSLIERARV